MSYNAVTAARSRRELAEVRNELAQVRSERDAARDTAARCIAGQLRAEDDAVRTRETCAAALHERDEARADRERTQAELALARKHLLALEARHEALIDIADEAEHKLGAEIVQLRNERDAVRSQRDGAQATVISVDDALRASRRDTAQVQAELEEARAKLRPLAAQLRICQAKRASRDEALVHMRRQLDEVRAERDQAHANLSALDEEGTARAERDRSNPLRGFVRFEVEATPHDSGLNGHEWHAGDAPAADAAWTLREIADRIERDWTEPVECTDPGTPGHEAQTALPAKRASHFEVLVERDQARAETAKVRAELEEARAKLASRDEALVNVRRQRDEADRMWSAARSQRNGWRDDALRYVGERDEARENLAEMRGNYERACKTIADMHAAAVGSVRGPIRGVVEDVADVRAELAEMRASHDGACKTVADMHAAAVGSVREPIRGVVQDVHDLRTCLSRVASARDRRRRERDEARVERDILAQKLAWVVKGGFERARAERDKSRSERDSLAQQLADRWALDEAANGEYARVLADRDKAHTRIAELKKQLADCNEQKANLSGQCTELEGMLGYNY